MQELATMTEKNQKNRSGSMLEIDAAAGGQVIGDLSRNLSRWEISCKCGCGFDSMDIETLKVFQECVDHIQQNSAERLIVDVHSGCRCMAWNDHEGGADNSYHLKARAIDFSIRGIDPALVAAYLSRKYSGRYGVGCYHTFTHLDTRSEGCWRKGC